MFKKLTYIVAALITSATTLLSQGNIDFKFVSYDFLTNYLKTNQTALDYVVINDTRELDWTNATIHIAPAVAADSPVTLRQLEQAAMAGYDFNFTGTATNPYPAKTSNMSVLSTMHSEVEGTNIIAAGYAAGDYVAGGIVTNPYTVIRSPVTFHFHSDLVGGNPSTIVYAHMEVYYRYVGSTNLLGDWESPTFRLGDDHTVPVMAQVAFEQPMLTNAVETIGFLKIDSVAGAAADIHLIYGGTYSSYMALDGAVPSTGGGITTESDPVFATNGVKRSDTNGWTVSTHVGLTNGLQGAGSYLVNNTTFTGTVFAAGTLNMQGNDVTNADHIAASNVTVSGTLTLGGEGRTNWAPYMCHVGWTNNWAGLAGPYLLTLNTDNIVPMNEKANGFCRDPYAMWATTNGTIPASGWWSVSAGAQLYRTNATSAARCILRVLTNTAQVAQILKVEDSFAATQSFIDLFVTKTLYLEAGTLLYYDVFPVGDNFYLTHTGNSTNTPTPHNFISLQYIGK